MVKKKSLIVGSNSVDSSHRLYFSVSLIPCCVCSVSGRTDLVWPTRLLLLIILGGQLEITRRLGEIAV